MTPPLPCRYALLEEAIALLDRNVDLSEAMEPCGEPAEFSTLVKRRRPGQDIEIYTLTCDGHDRLAQAVTGYVKSIALGRPKPDPT